jgi:hypothetical protein
MENVVSRSVEAPSEAEARAMAEPILDAFRAAGWELREALWVPGDRRPGLGESLLLSPESQLLLEGEGTFRLSFFNPDPLAVAPATVPETRQPDAFEDIGGVRYRRLVPRWGISLVVGIIGLILFLTFASGMSNGPFAQAPTPENGTCPIGWISGMKLDDSGAIVPDGTCVRMP